MPEQRRDDDEEDRLDPARRDQRAEPGLGDRRAAVARPSARAIEELGRPRYQVMRFQTIAPSRRAEDHGAGRPPRASISPLPIVLATAVPTTNAATKLKTAAQTTATPGREHAGRDHRGDRVGAVVEAVDEIEDQRDQRRSPGRTHVVRHAQRVLDGDGLEHVAGVLDVVQRLLQVVVDLLPLDHRSARPAGPRTAGPATRGTARRPPPRAA